VTHHSPRGAKPPVPVTRSMLREQIKDVIVERILDGVYGPGERIVEIRVAEEFGVSQAPVREALRELELLRFVTSEPFRGARVREVSPAELVEIYPVRAALEEVAARGAAPVLAGDVGPLVAELEAMRAAAARADVHDFIAHDVAFHRVIVEACGNRTLQELWNSLHVELRTTITLIKRVDDLLDVAEAHVAVLEALESGDADRAARALRDHIESFADWVPAIDTAPDDPAPDQS
jgi:DNA-binding GntR family transcriptional regulator